MKTIKEIKAELDLVNISEISPLLEIYRCDTRSGVQSLIQDYEKKLAKYNAEIQRIKNISRYEDFLYSKGYKYIAGIDEVGRGPLAGPVVTCAVILPKDCIIMGINDSKKLSEKKREELCEEIKQKALAISLAMSNVNTIDTINILQATLKAMQKSVNTLSIQPEHVLVDAVKIPDISMGQTDIIKGDENSISIAAASIVAKVTRDHMMEEFHELYPEYYFDKNKGYGTAEHIEAIKKYGLCPIHRRTFVKNIKIDSQQ